MSCVKSCELAPACLDTCMEAGAPVSPGWLAGSIILTLFLLCGSAFFSGLTLGLLSLDIPGLELIEACGEPEDREYAKQIIPLRQRGNQLLCTLLLGNTFVNSFIAISTASLTAGIVGTALSTAFILIFGEIIPQAVCSRYALYIGARAIPIVRVFMLLFYPLSFPISKLLDYALGRELRTVYNRKELDKLLSIAVEDPQGDLRPEEAHLMSSALAFSEKRASMIMTRLDHTFCIEVGSKLSFEALLRCYKSGFTRIPVYRKDPSCVVGLLFAKDLILVDPDDEIPVGAMLSFCGRSLHVVRHDTTIDKLLAAAQTQHSHLFFVVEGGPDAPASVAKWPPPISNVIGIVTLEDVLEELIAAEIVDETDTIRDNHSRLGVDMNAALRTKRMEFFYAIQAKRHPRRHISEEELRAITTFLIANAEPFARANVTHKGIRKLLNRCPVLTVEANPAHQGLATPVEPVFAKGRRTDRCCLVLSGQLRITCSEDMLVSEAGPWSILALAALTDDEYAPDYAAEVITTARLLFISRPQYRAMIDARPDGDGRPADAKWKGGTGTNGETGDGGTRIADVSASALSARVGHVGGLGCVPDFDRSSSPGPRSRTFDWDALTQRDSGASSVVESASAMLSRPPRPRIRAHDDSEAAREPPPAVSSSSFNFGLPVLSRSQSHPEVNASADGDELDEDQRPLCDMIADLGADGGMALGQRLPFEVPLAARALPLVLPGNGALAASGGAPFGGQPAPGGRADKRIPRSRSVID